MLVHSQQIGQLLCARVVQGFTRRCFLNATAKLQTTKPRYKHFPKTTENGKNNFQNEKAP